MVDLTAKKIALTVPTVVRCDCSIPPLQHKRSAQAQSLLSGMSHSVARRACALFSHYKTICGEKLHFPPKARAAVLAATIVMRYDRLISTMRVQPDDRNKDADVP